jgi:methylase of polypeptide subunit release factors
LEENGKEDIGDDLAGKFFFEKTGYSSFEEIIRENKILTLFDELAKHFNGGLFKLTATQKEELKDADISVLSNFLEGKLKDNQFVIWQEYSFKYIPVELISNFYEEFLPKEKKAGKEKETKVDTGAVYTPGFLVNFLVDECLPLTINELNENVKLIDISCGSGIFLSTCYKRLVQRWRIRNAKNGKLADTNPEILKTILLQNVFGVDINKNAVELTIFSLNLTMCAMLTPKQIWTQLQFDDLKEEGNIVEKNFFNHLVESKPSEFDLVIGNPPFKALNKKEYEKYADLLKEKGMPLLGKIPDNQLALMFLDKAMDLLKDTGLLCLIMPSGPMLYNNTIDFRSRFFDCYNIPQIIDFTFLRNSLFVNANVAVAALFAQKQMPDNEDILHVTVRRTKSNKERNYVEIDHYDFHNVPKSIACTSDFVWKCNLIGGGRIYHLVQKLKDGYRSLEDYLLDKKANNQWDYGQGYILGIQNRKFKADYITGKPSVIDKKFNEDGIQGIEIQNSEYFKDKSNEAYFQPPHLLIKKTIGKKAIPVEFRNDYLTFRNEILGIHCPENEVSELFALAETFKRNNELFRFFITTTSARFGVSRTPYTILLEDITELPFIEGNFELSFSEKILVNDVVNFSIDQFAYGENAQINHAIVDIRFLYDFSEIYCMALNSIYQEGEKKYVQSKIIEGEAFFACEYVFTDEDVKTKTSNSENDFEALIDHWNGRNALIKRVVRFYGENKIILIKPKQLRYWLKSIALRDADETLEEAFNQNASR